MVDGSCRERYGVMTLCNTGARAALVEGSSRVPLDSHRAVCAESLLDWKLSLTFRN